MKTPVRDRATVPWTSEREIPAVKLALSAWRKALKRKDFTAGRGVLVAAVPRDALPILAAAIAKGIAGDLEKLALIDERMRKEEGAPHA